MIFEICALLSVTLLAVLCFFAVRALISIQRITRNLETKLKNLDSLFRSVSNLGDLCESESQLFLDKKPSLEGTEKGVQFLEWMLLSVKLSKNLLTRR